MYVVTVDEMRRIERAADAAGLTYAEMMERAGSAVARVVRERTGDRPANVLLLVGPGNNGGDGLVAGRYLHEAGCAVTFYLGKREQTPDPNLERARALGIPLLRAEDDAEGLPALRDLLANCDVIVDALLGSGATGALRGTLRDVLRVVQEVRGARARTAPPAIQTMCPWTAGERSEHGGSPLPRHAGISMPPTRRGASPCAPSSSAVAPLMVAVDVPSGLNCDTGAADELTPQADVTVTFAWPKRGHYLYPGARRVGELLVADIGVDPALAEGILLQVATPEEVAALLPARPPDAHKGTFGKALVVGGCTHYTGAPALAALAAYRTGAGLVTLAVAERIHPIVASVVTEATYLVLPDDMGALVPDAWRVLSGHTADYSALLVGPGLGTEAATGEFVGTLLGGKGARRRPVGFEVSTEQPRPDVTLPPLVLDADALNLLARRDDWWRSLPADCVLTPHPGEMSRLLDCEVAAVQARRIEVAQEAAQRWGCCVALKGAHTVIAARDGRVTIIPFADAALATAGTGDVLAGAIVGLLAQHLGAYEAAVCGAYLHALAGTLWSRRHGSSGLLASDLLPLLPRAMRRVRRETQNHE